MILVSLFDTKAETWSKPSVCDSKASALRDFETLVNGDSRNLVASHPADFDLFQVGVWLQPSDGSKPSLQNPPFEHIANGLDVKRPDEEPKK